MIGMCSSITQSKRTPYLQEGELMIENQGEECNWAEEKFDSERVVVLVVGRFEFVVHQV